MSQLARHFLYYKCKILAAYPCTGSGDVAAFGWNEHGMCGTGNEKDVGVVTKVSGLPPHEDGGHMMVGAGAGHSLALVKVTGSANISEQSDLPGPEAI